MGSPNPFSNPLHGHFSSYLLPGHVLHETVSSWGGWFTSLALSEKRQHFVDTWLMSNTQNSQDQASCATYGFLGLIQVPYGAPPVYNVGLPKDR
eukprot:5705166-Pyramimonas_sp.AAC.3